MQVIDGQQVFSATDLVGFLACVHVTALELAAAARLVKRLVRPDPELDLLQLARHTKASALLQICSYVDQLARIEEHEPEHQDRG